MKHYKNDVMLSIYVALSSQPFFAFRLVEKTFAYQFAFNKTVLITWVLVITRQLTLTAF